jgi:hypothetical protein
MLIPNSQAAGSVRPWEVGSEFAARWALDEVYQLAADMSGMGFISVAECEVLHDNALMNIMMGAN